MRNAIFVGLITFLIMMAGGGAVAWFLQSAQAKKLLEEHIALFNAGPMKISYDAVEKAGFPLEIKTVIINPRLSGRVDLLLKNRLQPGAPELPEWNEEIALAGSIALSTNIFSDRFALAVSGDWKNQSAIGGKTISTTTKQNGGGVMCALQLKRGWGWLAAMPWNTAVFSNRSPEEMMKEFRSLDCVYPEHNMSDSASGTALIRHAPGRFYVSNAPSGEANKLRFYLKLADFEVTPEGDALFSEYGNLLMPQQNFASSWAAYGKQNVEIDFSYDGPLQDDAAKAAVPIIARIDKMTFSNQVSQGVTTLDFSLIPGDGKKSLKLSFKSESTFNSGYAAVMQQVLRGSVRQYYANKDAAPPFLRQALERRTPDEFYNILAPALPDVHSLGKITVAADVSGWLEQSNNGFDLKISALEISALPYGLTGKGEAARAENQFIPTANITVVCANCLQLVEDAFAYAMRLERVFADLSPENKPISGIDAATGEGMKKFLQALAATSPDAAVAKDFTYAIVSDGKSGITINGKPVVEVMALYQQMMDAARAAKNQ